MRKHGILKVIIHLMRYSHLSNKRGGWNKCGGGAKFAKSLNVEVGINKGGWDFVERTNA